MESVIRMYYSQSILSNSQSSRIPTGSSESHAVGHEPQWLLRGAAITITWKRLQSVAVNSVGFRGQLTGGGAPYKLYNLAPFLTMQASASPPVNWR